MATRKNNDKSRENFSQLKFQSKSHKTYFEINSSLKVKISKLFPTLTYKQNYIL